MLDLIIGAIAIIGVAGKLMSGSENSHVDSVGQHLENAEHNSGLSSEDEQRRGEDGEKVRKEELTGGTPCRSR